MLVRDEEQKHWAAVHAVNASAFETPAEANLVDALREQAHPIVSLVALDAETVVGHIMFSPVSLSDHPDLNIMGLAPMAVAPEYQRKGIGSALVRAGLDRCKLGFGAVVVLGHSKYYPRFSFSPSTRFGIGCEYEVPEGYSWSSSCCPATFAMHRAPSNIMLRSVTYNPPLNLTRCVGAAHHRIS